MDLDTNLKQRVIACDKKAQIELYQLCFNLMISVARRYKRNIEDQQTLVNNSFMKIVKNLEKYNDENNFSAWVKRIITNEVIDDYRKSKTHKELINQDYPVENLEVAEYGEIEYEHSKEELLAMIDSLPKATKNIFNLFAIDGYSHKEICEKLNISAETSKWHMREARRKLIKMVKKQDK